MSSASSSQGNLVRWRLDSLARDVALVENLQAADLLAGVDVESHLSGLHGGSDTFESVEVLTVTEVELERTSR